MTNRRVFMGAGAALASSGLLSLPVLANTPIKLGAVLPFSGGLELFGNQAKIGMDLAVAEINAAGGILGRKVEVIYQDDKTDPKTAVERTTQLIQKDKVLALFGPITSSNRDAMMPAVKRGKTPLHFAVASGREDLCSVLLANGSNPNAATTIERETPLHRCMMWLCAAEDDDDVCVHLWMCVCVCMCTCVRAFECIFYVSSD